MVVQKCLRCENPVKRPGNIYCSKSCCSKHQFDIKGRKTKSTVSCQQCHRPFQVWPYREATAKFCSVACKRLADSIELKQRLREKHPNFSRTPRICWYCGQSFTAPPGQDRRNAGSQRVFCSMDCWRNYSRVELACEQCGNIFVVQRHRKDIARFCTHTCYATWLSLHQAGENHPNWKGGWEPYYGSDWPRQRQACRERDSYTCRICSHTRDEVGSENLDVHHYIPYRVSKDNSLGNLITLCDRCHHDVENGRVACPNP